MQFYEDFDNGAKTYFNSLKKYKPLSKKEERKLLTRYKGLKDIDARNTLIQSNLKYACKLASSYRGRGLGYLELISEANNGLIESIDKYDMKNDVKLISYSKWWIMQRMQAAIEKRNKMPESDLPEEDTNENYDSDDIEPCVQTKNKFEISFEIEDEVTDRENDLKLFINKMFTVLDERESDMINMYYGRLYGQAFTLEEIGQKYGLTKERVRQVIKKAFRKIRSEAILTDSNYLSSKN
jgi:RNA polymerase primary sigma factor